MDKQTDSGNVEVAPPVAAECSVGIDVGSSYISAAVLDPGGNLIRHEYRRHEGNVVETTRDIIDALGAGDASYAAKTGNGAEQIEGAGEAIDPTIALLYGTKNIYPDVRNIIYIGAGSFYLIILNEKGEYLKHIANTACASGTGAFLDQQAIRLGVAPEELHRLTDCSKSCPSVATRCAVFAKTDIIHLQQTGHSREDIAAGICRGMAESTLDVLLRGKSLHGQTVVIGGVARNREIIKYLEKDLGFKVDIPERPEIVGAIGAAIYAADGSDKIPDILNVARPKDLEREGQLTRKPLVLEKSDYPDFTSFDFRIDEDGTEIALARKPEKKQYDAVLGVDVGSTSTKAVLVTPDREVILTLYRKTAGHPIEATQLLLKAMREEMKRFEFTLNIIGVGTTGSGRKLIKKVLKADTEMNEITAHARAAVHIDPKVDTILEIGGQDAKFTQLEDGVVYNSTMNYVCAAGTGSFIEEQAKRLGISIWDYGDLTLGVSPPRTSDRCTVFMERDLDVLFSRGWSKKEVAAAVLYSVCENYLNKVVSGQHIGERVYFQGATARNKALVAAFEQTLGKAIIVSPYCHLTGAYGMALLMLDSNVSESSFRGVDFADAVVGTTSEQCTICNNKCDLTVIDIDGEKVGWGMKCGKEYSDESPAAKKGPHYDLFRLRKKLLREFAGTNPEEPSFIVAMPMSLTSYTYLPLWGTMFRNMGGRVIVSPHTTETTLKQGLRYTQAEFCAPVIASHGHIAGLAKDGADLIFVPHMIHAREGGSYTNSHFCPFVQSHASVIKATNVMEGWHGKFAAPVIDFPDGRDSMARALHESLKEAIDVDLPTVGRALDAGLLAQEEFTQRIKDEGKKVLKQLEESGEMGIVILGRPYNTNDPGLNVDLPVKIADMGVTVIPMDFLEEGEFDERWINMYWDYGQYIIDAARTVMASDNLFGVLFSNFCCGPDSYLITYFKEIMSERRKPFLVVQFDAHGADAGYVTRVEAAMESFKAWQPRPRKVPRPVKQLKKIDRSRTIFFSAMDPILAPLFTAAFQGEGFRSEILREDEETLDIGYKHILGSECVPCPSTLGSFIKTMEDRNLSPSKVALFMPTASGPCRFGQYNCLNRIVFEKKGWDDVDIISPSSHNSYMGLPSSLRKNLWKSIVCGDILSKMLLKVRPYEAVPGTTDKLLDECTMALAQSLRNEGRGLTDALAASAEKFSRVERTNSRKPKVGIVGEIYVRSNAFLNQDVVGCIERLGGEALKTSVAEWIFYTTVLHRYDPGKGLKGFLETVKGGLQTRYFNHVEHKFYELAKKVIHDRPEPKIEEIMEVGRKYVPIKFYGEAILTIGRALIFIEREGVDAIVNASPTFCMPGTTTTSIFAKIEDEIGVPIICNFYDGSGEPNKVLRPHLYCLKKKMEEETAKQNF